MRSLHLYSVIVLFVSISWCEGGFHKEDCRALYQIRDSLNNSDINTVSYWFGDNCCEWGGVGCELSSPFRVVFIGIRNFRKEEQGKWYPNATLFAQLNQLKYLILVQNQIGGWVLPQALCGLKHLHNLSLSYNYLDDQSLPPCLWHKLPSLKSLDLSYNWFKGSFGTQDALCGLKNLRELDLSYNLIDDGSLPRCLWRNSSLLEYLFLSDNNLNGRFGLPKEFCELRKLEVLDLEHNLFEGSIPPCLGQMSSLVALYLSNNRFKGSIPLTLLNSSTIESIYFSNNQLEGVVPFSMFANLSTLRGIDLSSNKLDVETEFSTWVPSFQLNDLGLVNCNLNRRSGSKTPSFLATQYNLRHVSLSHNALQGTIPSWIFYNNSLLQLSLRGNMFNGSFPKASFQFNSSRLVYLDISDNDVDGLLPTHLNLLFPKLADLNMSSNSLEGCIPASFGDLINLGELDLSNNALSGKIPRQLTRNGTSLIFLDLSNNKLHGDLLPIHSKMSDMMFLYLSGNNFTGTIPKCLKNSHELVVLDLGLNNLSGEIPAWLAQFTEIAALLLRGNNFEGQIPMHFCQAMNLHMLDLSDNNLSGNIPSCLNQVNTWKEESSLETYQNIGFSESSPDEMGKVDFSTKGGLYTYKGGPLRLMTGIDFSMNRLTGNIPLQLGDLIELRSLNLSNNLLKGPLPTSLKNMKNLESLDLSHNHLVGTIPPQLVQLNFLAVFSVAFNNLSGAIPFEQNFRTFSESSYTGNMGLCGRPLETNCSSFGNDPSSQLQDNRKEEEEDDDELGIVDGYLIFYSSFAISFVLGFWCVVAPLLFSVNWRKKYYGAMDDQHKRLLRSLHCLKNCCLNK